jgi:hypothetical protein
MLRVTPSSKMNLLEVDFQAEASYTRMKILEEVGELGFKT